MTVNKQQVTLSDRMWGILTAAGVFEVIKEMQRRFRLESKERAAVKERARNRKSGRRRWPKWPPST